MKKTPKRSWWSALLGGGCLVLLTACGDQRPVADFSFISGSEHNTLDPQKMSWSHDVRVARLLYETLVTLDFSDLSIDPGVAESWEVSEDGLTYTFRLREDAKWSNGKPVVASDFIAGWRRAMMPDEAADYAKLMFRIKGAKAFYDYRTQQLADYVRIKQSSATTPTGTASEAARATYELAMDHFADTVGVSAPDDRTLVVELAGPCPYFLELVAFVTFAPIPEEVIDAHLKINDDTGMARVDPAYWTDPARLVGNGPYQLSQRAFRQYVFMTANPFYWDRAAMKNGSILELIISEPQTAMLAYQAGEADLWVQVPSGSSLAAELIRQDRPDLHREAMAGTYFYNFNCQPKLNDGRANPFVDPRVRRAFSMAIDRRAIVERVTRMNQPIALTYIPPGSITGYTPPAQDGVTFDPDQARKLLAEAGHPDGAGLDGLSILYNTNAGHENIAQAIKNMWEQHLNVSVSLEGVEVKVFSARLKNQDFIICRASWFGDYPDPTTFLDKMKTGDGNNDCGWSNPRFDALLERAETQSGAERMRTLEAAEAVLLEDQPMALLFQYENLYLWDPAKVKGLHANAWARWRFEDVSVERQTR